MFNIRLDKTVRHLALMFDIILTNKLFKLHNLFLKKNGHYHSSVLCFYLFYSSIFSSFKVFWSFLLFAAGPFQQTKTTPDNGHFKHRQYTHKTKQKQTSNLNNKREDIRGKFCWHKPYASVTRCFFFLLKTKLNHTFIYRRLAFLHLQIAFQLPSEEQTLEKTT